MIRICDLDFAYPNGPFRLRLPELQLPRGTHAAFIGPSGSGKTTLLYLLGGVLTPRAGHIWAGELEITALEEASRRDFRLRRIGMVFQEFELIEYLTVRDNILLPYRLCRRLRLNGAVMRRAEALAEKVALGDKLDRFVDCLSFGERQRVGLCRALVIEPELVLADEPTAGLDPASKALVVEALLGYARSSGATLVMVTHDGDLLPHFDQVIDLGSFQEAKP